MLSVYHRGAALQFLASDPLSRMSLNREHLASFELKNVFLTLPFFIYGYNCQPNIFPVGYCVHMCSD